MSSTPRTPNTELRTCMSCGTHHMSFFRPHTRVWSRNSRIRLWIRAPSSGTKPEREILREGCSCHRREFRKHAALTTVTFTVTGHSSSGVVSDTLCASRTLTHVYAQPVITPSVNSLSSPSHPVPSSHSEPVSGSSVSESKSSWISSVPEPTEPATGSSVPGTAPHTSGHSSFPYVLPCSH